MSVSAARVCAGVGDRAGGAPDNTHAIGVTDSALNMHYMALTPYVTTCTNMKMWQTLAYDMLIIRDAWRGSSDSAVPCT